MSNFDEFDETGESNIFNLKEFEKAHKKLSRMNISESKPMVRSWEQKMSKGIQKQKNTN